MSDLNRFKVGDTIVVKPDVMCPDSPDFSLAGWQGRVAEVYGEEGTLLIHWDSLTLRAMPEDYVREGVEEGLEWDAMVLEADDVVAAVARDTPDDVQQAYDEIASAYAWDHLTDNPGIREVLTGVDAGDTRACLEAWGEHLGEVLQFPFEAEIVEMMVRGPLRIGDRVQVTGIELADESYGLIASLRRGREQFEWPLCDLEATKRDAPNYQPLRDYVVWYANR